MKALRFRFVGLRFRPAREDSLDRFFTTLESPTYRARRAEIVNQARTTVLPRALEELRSNPRYLALASAQAQASGLASERVRRFHLRAWSVVFATVLAVSTVAVFATNTSVHLFGMGGDASPFTVLTKGAVEDRHPSESQVSLPNPQISPPSTGEAGLADIPYGRLASAGLAASLARQGKEERATGLD